MGFEDILLGKKEKKPEEPKPISKPTPTPKPKSKPKEQKEPNRHILTEENLLHFIKAKGKIKLYECYWIFAPVDTKDIEILLKKLLQEQRIKKDRSGWFSIK